MYASFETKWHINFQMERRPNKAKRDFKDN